MEWGAGQTAYAVVGALFLSVAVIGAGLRRQLSLATMHVMATGAATFLGLVLAPPGALGTWQATAIAGVAVLAAALAPVALARDLTGQAGVRRTATAVAASPCLAPAADDDTGSGGAVALPPGDLGIDPTAMQLASLAYRRPELRVAIAAHPSTPASVLEWLAQFDNPLIHQAIASRSLSRSR